MTIKAIQMYKDGFVQQPFVFGGEEGKDAFDASIRYPQSLQNFVVDTGDEVILVDTGVPDDFAVPAPGPQTALHLGEKIQNYLDGLRALGYAPEQVTKILITHKHPDHTGQLAAFPNAKVYMSRAEADAMKLDGGNIVRCDFTDGPYYEFPASQLVAPGVRLLPAVGHTTGNSIIVVEDGGLFYMMHGDVTYCDEALKANKLSLVFEDKAAARETLNRVRAFIKARPTVYLSTHYPTGVTNLETNRVMKLDGIPVGCPADGGAGYYGKAKGTPLEKTLAQLAAGEAQGGGMYYALARIAQGFGLAAVAEELIDLGNQETNHAGFYWTLVGKYPQDKTAFWKLLAGLSKAEYKGDANIGAIAAKLEEMGLKDAAAEARVYAKQELHHGVATQAILEKYAPEFIAPQPGGKRYVCPVCGYEHEGDLDALPDDWKCPICGAAKKAFKELT